MGGGKSEAKNLEMDNARLQNQTMRDMLSFSKDRTARMDTLQQPLIDFTKSIATGDKTAMRTATAPLTSEISKSFGDARSNILDTMPSGAGREFTLGQLERDKANKMSGVGGNTYLQALDTLAKLGQGQGEFGLQQAGAGLRAGEGSTQAAGAVMQADSQRKAAQMGLLGNIAGAAGFAMGKK